MSVDASAAAPSVVNLRARDLCQSGRSREARDLLSGALPFIERRGDRAALRQALNLLGAASFETGQLPDAEAAFDRALELGRTDGDDALVAKATNNLGAIANVRGERERALAMYSLAVAAYQRLGQAFGLAAAYHNMAITFRHIGLLERADDYERRAIEFALEADDARLLSLARIGRAELCLLRGDARLAEATALLVAREFASRTEPTQQANALRVAGAARTALGDLDGARRLLDEGLKLARDYGAALVEAELLRARAELSCWRHERLTARQDATAAIRIFESLDAREDGERLSRWLAAVEADPDGDC
ncbi:MAG TPA: tetratricopeptide repeat protein [Gemmatimonadaceae bacterium]|jgi:tetratricopeptide (TPR) repeat protein|nr:tetratricopeptide repeat protein [Gemmatimonadaceae bacterium]